MFYDIFWSHWDPDDLIGSGSDQKGSDPAGSAALLLRNSPATGIESQQKGQDPGNR